MEKWFNIAGTCFPKRHYMVDLSERLVAIRKMVEKGYYFVINKGRQYGKTTTLYAMEETLNDDYVVISLDFQIMSTACFATESVYVKKFCKHIVELLKYSRENRINGESLQALREFGESADEKSIDDLSVLISQICAECDTPIILIIDEVDSASNYAVFVDFLAMLRLKYLNREKFPTFQSVVLAGVHDVRHLKAKIRPEGEHKINSPWNIAAEFNVRMWFNAEEIGGMLRQYEEDHHTGMDIERMAARLFDYTQGYPVMVSWLCKRMDEDFGGRFCEETLGESVRMMLGSTDVAVFGSMMHQVEDHEDLCELLRDLVYMGRKIPYNPDDKSVGLGLMFSYLRRDNDRCVVANWIFEQRLFAYFVSQDMKKGETARAFDAGGIARNMFIMDDGRLDMDRVMEKFVEYFSEIYNERDCSFVEKMGRKLFIVYMKPIINGTGNYYVEAETRDETRTDLVVDYLGERFVVEMKIWHGDEYNERGRKQLKGYLDHFHLEKGYLLSFSFKKDKKVGMNKILVDGKTVVEAVV